MSSVLRAGATDAPLHAVDNVAVTSVGHDKRQGQCSSPSTLASSDQIRSRDARQVCPVLWSELRVDGQDRHGAPVRHVCEDADEQMDRLGREDNLDAQHVDGGSGHGHVAIGRNEEDPRVSTTASPRRQADLGLTPHGVAAADVAVRVARPQPRSAEAV